MLEAVLEASKKSKSIIYLHVRKIIYVLVDREGYQVSNYIIYTLQ